VIWYAAKRVALLVPVLLVVSMATFAMILAVPGDPASRIAGPNATPDQVDRIREQLGLDQALPLQYLDWLGGLLTGDLGNSLLSLRPVSDMVLERLPVTISLSVTALLFGTVLGIVLGAIAALNHGKAADRAVMLFSSLGIATPNYWLALLLILFCSLKTGWFPTSQYVPFGESPSGWAEHLVLPGLALGAAFAAETTRQVRSAILEVKDLPYVTTARSQGIRPSALVGKYIAKNAAVPVITVIGLQFTRILGGAVLIEQIFSLPGIGTLMVTAVLSQDIPVVQGVIFGAVCVTVLVNLLVDLSYAAINPKVRSQWR